MGDYWARVFKQAWADTRQFFGWNQKSAATALVAIAGLLPLYFTTGLPAVKEHAIQYLWYGAPFLIAGVLLFCWNFASAQAKLYAKLVESSSQTEKELRKRLTAPNYEAFKNVQEFRLYEAACLWSDLAPSLGINTTEAQGWLRALKEATGRGELEHVPQTWDNHDIARRRGMDVEVLIPADSTVVTRRSLVKFAKRQGAVPRFLRDD